MVRITKYFSFLVCILIFYTAQAQDTVIVEAPTEVAPVVEAPKESYDNESNSSYYDRKEFGYFESNPKFEERKLSEEEVSKVRNDDAYWYANLEPEPKKVEKKKEIVVESAGWLNALFWVLLVGAFIALLVWLLSSSNISLFRRSPEDFETGDEEVEENIFERNFEKEIQNAVAAENYRLGVRLMYLQILRQMADRRIINYTAEKTNSDYLFQLAPTKYYKDFSRLTRNFDFVWYGQFPLSLDSFSVLQKDFYSFKQSLG